MKQKMIGKTLSRNGEVGYSKERADSIVHLIQVNRGDMEGRANEGVHLLYFSAERCRSQDAAEASTSEILPAPCSNR